MVFLKIFIRHVVWIYNIFEYIYCKIYWIIEYIIYCKIIQIYCKIIQIYCKIIQYILFKSFEFTIIQIRLLWNDFPETVPQIIYYLNLQWGALENIPAAVYWKRRNQGEDNRNFWHTWPLRKQGTLWYLFGCWTKKTGLNSCLNFEVVF